MGGCSFFSLVVDGGGVGIVGAGGATNLHVCIQGVIFP